MDIEVKPVDNSSDEAPPVTFAGRFLNATGEYALFMVGAMFIAFLWMAKDVVFASVSSTWLQGLVDLLLVFFVVRHAFGSKHVLIPIMAALGFAGIADSLRKSQFDADRSAGKRPLD